MRRKCSASSCSIVPTVTPRDRCERNLTHSNRALGSWCRLPLERTRLNSSQVWLVVSQTSVVSVPRTARAFSRAAATQALIDDGLPASRTMKSMTCRLSKFGYLAANECVNSEMPNTPRQPCSACSADCGSSDIW